MTLLLPLVALAAAARAQPCAQDGSSSEVSVLLTYSTATGKFAGSITSNGCSPHLYCEGCDPFVPHEEIATEQLFPAFGLETPPNPINARSRVGMTTAGGIEIDGPMQWGFVDGAACEGGTCPPGIDVPLCVATLEFQCGDTLNRDLFPDTGGGHTGRYVNQTYHYHKDMPFVYDSTDAGVHSPLLGVALDGHGIYGLWEGDGAAPDVDACNGHFGVTPESVGNTVYHYHFTTDQPYSLGCYGPVASLAECEQMYPACTDPTYLSIETADGVVEYAVDCPCFKTRAAARPAVAVPLAV
eukprot:TRINITY_DN3296_c0_g2_i1.p2 TRINITY_DN3296_c0_g2~~TRINITY_DN3296_c0_g2_i1.p2  ORF type:complete len:298 (+),score=51.34 TRINITY_DN3296_c0_g2_i1:25-918(+)